MKRFFALIAIICAVSFCSAQNGSKAKTESATHNGAEIKFEKTVCDLGTVKLNQVVTDTYTFTNIGKKPLSIRIDGAETEYILQSIEKADVEINVPETIMQDIVAGRMTFQRAFMTGEMKIKGDFKILRALDEIFVFMD